MSEHTDRNWKPLVGKRILARQIGAVNPSEIEVLESTASGSYVKIQDKITGCTVWISRGSYECVEVLGKAGGPAKSAKDQRVDFLERLKEDEAFEKLRREELDKRLEAFEKLRREELDKRLEALNLSLDKQLADLGINNPHAGKALVYAKSYGAKIHTLEALIKLLNDTPWADGFPKPSQSIPSGAYMFVGTHGIFRVIDGHATVSENGKPNRRYTGRRAVQIVGNLVALVMLTEKPADYPHDFVTFERPQAW